MTITCNYNIDAPRMWDQLLECGLGTRLCHTSPYLVTPHRHTMSHLTVTPCHTSLSHHVRPHRHTMSHLTVTPCQTSSSHNVTPHCHTMSRLTITPCHTSLSHHITPHCHTMSHLTVTPCHTSLSHQASAYNGNVIQNHTEESSSVSEHVTDSLRHL